MTLLYCAHLIIIGVLLTVLLGNYPLKCSSITSNYGEIEHTIVY